MAPSKKSSSSSLTAKTYNTRGRAVADKATKKDEKNTLTTGQTKKPEKIITKWLGEDNDGTNLVTNNSPKKGQVNTKQVSTAVKKTQQKLSGYFSTTKTITSAGEEEVRETKTKESVKETTYEPGQKVTREQKKIITDTTTIITKASDSGKKRKLVKDEDAANSVDMPASKVLVVDGVDSGDEDDSTDRLPRRQAAKAINVSPLCPFSHHSANDFQFNSHIDNSGLADNPEGADRVTDLEDISASTPKSLTITLSLPKVNKPAVLVKKRRVRAKPASGWDNPDYYFKFGWTPFSEHLSPNSPNGFPSLRDPSGRSCKSRYHCRSWRARRQRGRPRRPGPRDIISYHSRCRRPHYPSTSYQQRECSLCAGASKEEVHLPRRWQRSPRNHTELSQSAHLS